MRTLLDIVVAFVGFTVIIGSILYMILYIDPPKQWVPDQKAHYEYVVPKE